MGIFSKKKNIRRQSLSSKEAFKKRLRSIDFPLAVIAILIITLLVVHKNYTISQAFAWYNSNWDYSKTVQITNGGGAQSNYDFFTVVDTATLIGEGKLKADCSDLRFINSDDSTNLDYWMETSCDTSDTQIWVRIPSLASGTTDIYMYYGNTSATATGLTWSGKIFTYADTACAAGYTYEPAFLGRFIMGGSSYGSLGGADTHGHADSTCTTSGFTGSSFNIANSIGDYASSTTHTHNLTASVNSASNSPLYRDALVCSTTKFEAESGVIAMSGNTTLTGWTRFTPFDGVYPRANSAYGTTGGADTHTHTVTPTATSSSASGSRETPSISFGDGSDGAVTFTANTNINTTNKISGRTCTQGGDAVNYSVTSVYDVSATYTQAIVTPSPVGDCLVAGDQVLLINLQGTASDYSTVGNYEIFEVLSVSGTQVRFTRLGTKTYSNPMGTTYGTQRVMLQRIPQYSNVTVNAGVNVYPSAWNGIKGGVLAFKASGVVSVSGTIHANYLGYKSTNSNESFCGLNGGGAPAARTEDGNNGLCGGGGGGGGWDRARGYGSATGGAGAGGGTSHYAPSSGAGGGGGYGTFGYAGVGYGSPQNGGTNISGNGGNGCTTCPDGNKGGGGGGGGTYGTANLSKLYFGSPGSAGATNPSAAPGVGGNGGGIVLIYGNDLNIGNSVLSYGQNGTNASASRGGSGAGGAGGSILLVGNTVDFTTVRATGGSGGTVGSTGGTGGSGRIAVEYVTSRSGNSVPTANISQIGLAGTTIGTHTHMVTSGANTTATSNEIPYIGTVFHKSDAQQTFDTGSILMTDTIPPLGWTEKVNYRNNFAVGSGVYGATGGNSTHASQNVLLSAGTPSINAIGALSGGTTVVGNSHSHSCTAYFPPATNLPRYITAIFIEKDDNSADSISSVTGVEIMNIPNVPTEQTPGAISTTEIRWNFLDTSINEDGVRVYNDSNSLMQTCGVSDITFCNESGLSANSQYTRKFAAYNAFGQSDYSGLVTAYTLANVPTITASVQTDASILLSAGNVVNLGSGQSAVYFDCLDASCDGGINSWSSSTGDTATSLLGNTGYEFAVKARNGDGFETAYSTSTTEYTHASVPTISLGTKATDSLELLAANTDNITSGTSGLYYDCTGTSCDTGLNLWTTSLSDIPSGLLANTKYTFAVKARNYDSIETAFSATTEGYTLAEVPGIITTGQTVSSVDLSATGITNITSDTSGVYFDCLGVSCDSGINGWIQIIDDTATGLNANTSYDFVARARNGNSIETIDSVTLSATTLADSPTLSISNITDTTISLTAGNIQNITLDQSGLYFDCTLSNCDIGINSWIQVDTDIATALIPNTSYDFIVKARNGEAAETNFSASENVITYAELPSVPVVSPVSSDTVSVIISAGNNPAITEYLVQEESTGKYVDPINGVLVVGQVWDTYVNFNESTGVDVSGLDAGVNYSFKVKARNADSIETAFSATSSAYTSLVAPVLSTPTVVDQYSINWNFTDPNSFEDGVKIYDGNDALIKTCATADITLCLEDTLSANVQYIRKVKAYSSNTESDFSNELSTYTYATAPTISLLENSSGGNVELQFNPQDNATDTEFLIRINSLQYWDFDTLAPVDTPVWASSITFGNNNVMELSLSPDKTYTFDIKARNHNDIETAYTAPQSQTNKAQVPGTPIISDITNSTYVVKLDPRTNPSTTFFALFETTEGKYLDPITKLFSNTVVWGTYVDFGGSIGLEMTGYEANVGFAFYAKAKNILNVETGNSSVITGYTLQESPTISIDGVGVSSLKLKFGNTKRLQIGTSGVRIECNTPNCPAFNDWLTVNEKVITELKPNTNYQFRVQSRNSQSKVTDFSNWLSIYTLAQQPEILDIDILDGQSVKLFIDIFGNPSITKVCIKEFSTDTFYNLETGVLQEEKICVPIVGYLENNSVTIEGLLPGVKYEFGVLAINEAGTETATHKSDGQMKYIMELDETKRGFLLSEGEVTEINVSLANGAQVGVHSIRLYESNKPAVDISLEFAKNFDWKNAKIEISEELNATAVDFTEIEGISDSFTIYALKGDTTHVRICQSSKSLDDLLGGCKDEIIISGDLPQTYTQDDLNLVIDTVSIEEVEYWKVDGVTGTAIQGFTPEVTVESEGEVVVVEEESTFTKAVQSVQETITQVATQTAEVVSEAAVVTAEFISESEEVTVAAAAATAVVIVPTAVVGSTVAIVELPLLIQRFVISILGFFGIKKKGKKFGYIYDSVTKAPLSLAVIRFYDENKHLAETEVSGGYGNFDSSIPKGKYRIVISKSGYKYPSTIVTGKTDGPISNIYHGELGEYNKTTVAELSIPLDQVELGVKEKAYKFGQVILKTWNVLGFILFGLGVIQSAINAFESISIANIFILVGYLVLFILLLIKTRLFTQSGAVYKEGELKSGVEVQLVKAGEDRVLDRRITDNDGKYQFVVTKGNYEVSVVGFNDFIVKGGSNFENKSKRPTVLGKRIDIS
jgi:hypothetical protein